jgi:hypothetical protein
MHHYSWRTTVTGLIALLALAGLFAWLNDFITLQGERTIYTVECEGGPWNGDTCAGRLVAGSRYRFRALRIHDEVLFWRVGVREQSGRLAGCNIQDGRNWQCPPGAEAARSITLVMDHGEAVPGPVGTTLAFHPVPKWRWLFLRWTGRSAH